MTRDEEHENVSLELDKAATGIGKILSDLIESAGKYGYRIGYADGKEGKDFKDYAVKRDAVDEVKAGVMQEPKMNECKGFLHQDKPELLRHVVGVTGCKASLHSHMRMTDDNNGSLTYSETGLRLVYFDSQMWDSISGDSAEHIKRLFDAKYAEKNSVYPNDE